MPRSAEIRGRSSRSRTPRRSPRPWRWSPPARCGGPRAPRGPLRAHADKMRNIAANLSQGQPGTPPGFWQRSFPQPRRHRPRGDRGPPTRVPGGGLNANVFLRRRDQALLRGAGGGSVRPGHRQQGPPTSPPTASASKMGSHPRARRAGWTNLIGPVKVMLDADAPARSNALSTHNQFIRR